MSIEKFTEKEDQRAAERRVSHAAKQVERARSLKADCLADLAAEVANAAESHVAVKRLVELALRVERAEAKANLAGSMFVALSRG